MAAEYTANASQSVAVGGNVLFTDTVASPCSCNIMHRDNSGLVFLRGKGRYKIDFGANIGVSTAGTAASLDIALNGEPTGSSVMIVTPAVSNDLNNVSTTAFIDVPCGCCISVSVTNVGTLSTEVQNANIVIEKVG